MNWQCIYKNLIFPKLDKIIKTVPKYKIHALYEDDTSYDTNSNSPAWTCFYHTRYINTVVPKPSFEPACLTDFKLTYELALFNEEFFDGI